MSASSRRKQSSDTKKHTMGRIRISLFRRMGIKEYHGLGGDTTFPSFLLYQMIPYQTRTLCRAYTGVGCFFSFTTLHLDIGQVSVAQSLLVCAPGRWLLATIASRNNYFAHILRSFPLIHWCLSHSTSSHTT
jgi:hypothetical protein